jgi:nitroreductase
MSRIDKKLLIHNLEWRYATKKFDSHKKIQKEDLNTLLESMSLAPSSYGLQPFQFLVVENEELRKTLKPASYNQSQITDASHLVVITTLKTVKGEQVDAFIQRIVKTRGVSKADLKDYEGMLKGDVVNGPRASTIQSWTQRQAYISIGFLLAGAALLEIDACPMEGVDLQKYDEILNLKNTDYSTIAVVALGYRSSEDPYQKLKKVRKPIDELFQFLK